jgi:glycosyltransferase involved in cell wall biosynthesis
MQIKKNRRVLFLSYDGLLDALGQSQIVPYLKIIDEHVEYLHVISFEKENPVNTKYNIPQSIGSSKIKYNNRSIFKILLNILKFLICAIYITRTKKINVIHARSYIPMLIGYVLRFICNGRVSVIFDMRGFWPDDKVDGGRWKLEKFLDRSIYHIFKGLEKRFIITANYVIVLTENAKSTISNMVPEIDINKLLVIPCCADYNHFKVLEKSEIAEIRSNLGISSNSILISYIGSLGSIYGLKEILAFFCEAKKQYESNVEFLIVTQNWDMHIESEANKLGYIELLPSLCIVKGNWTSVPKLLGASDVMLSFRKSSFSQIAASPTKIGEALACGVPVVSNKGIGDIDNQLNCIDGGILIDTDIQSISKAVFDLDTVVLKRGNALRERSRRFFALETAEKKFKNLYNEL